jgi:hypothetical protein
MDETEVLDLLKTKVPLNMHSTYDAEMLINALECIPLAIAHAGSYIQMRYNPLSIPQAVTRE